jgi:hypothetical protein
LGEFGGISVSTFGGILISGQQELHQLRGEQQMIATIARMSSTATPAPIDNPRISTRCFDFDVDTG